MAQVVGTVVVARPMSMPPMQHGMAMQMQPMQQGMDGLPAGAVMGLPAGAVMGMPPRNAAPAQTLSLEAQAQVPKGVEPGGTFTASTPDGQHFELTVPEGTEPGARLSFSYVPSNPTATVVGMPIGMARLGTAEEQWIRMHGLGGVNGMPPLGGHVLDYVIESDQEKQDRQHSEIGWVLYCAGWALCVCCGPVGPVFWFGVACMHWCRPKAERERLPREHTLATVSLVTGAFGSLIVFLLFLAVASHAIRNPHGEGSYGHQDGHHHKQRMRGHW